MVDRSGALHLIQEFDVLDCVVVSQLVGHCDQLGLALVLPLAPDIQMNL